MQIISDGSGHRSSTTVGVRILVIVFSHGIKISAVHCLVLSQSTRVTDGRTIRWTDGRTDGRTDRITTPQTVLA